MADISAVYLKRAIEAARLRELRAHSEFLQHKCEREDLESRLGLAERKSQIEPQQDQKG